MQNTSNQNPTWTEKQEVFISSLKRQPLIVVLRPKIDAFKEKDSKKILFNLLENLQNEGIKHIEIAWLNDNFWKETVEEILCEFKGIKLGAASVNNSHALNIVKEIGLQYAMLPFWDPLLIKESKKINQLLIPGVFSPSEIHQAINERCKIVKLFPASSLGFHYLNQLKGPISSLPFIIAAGGVKTKDIDEWLNSGYGAIAIGRSLKEHQSIPSSLKVWLNKYKEIN